MKKCTLTFEMWHNSLEEECSGFKDGFATNNKQCETCKWYKEV